MVGVVIVSHSKKIAEGCKELAEQMIVDDVIIEAAGGCYDGGIGTDVNKIHQSILNVMNDDGVVVLVDLGSAVMSSEMAIEMLDEKQQKLTKIVDAPLVEGAITGALEASMGSNLDSIIHVLQEMKTQSKF